MKKIALIAILLLGISVVAVANLYMCKNKDCITVIIEDDTGFSWAIMCTDGSEDAGFTRGASYGGNCEILEVH